MNLKIPKIEISKGTLIPKMGIGTWGIGGYMKKSDYNDDKNDVAQMKYEIENGLTVIDCWLAQAEGNLVKLINIAIKPYDRKTLFLVAKFDVKNFTKPENIEEKCKEYLTALGTDYLDMVQVHSPNYGELGAKNCIEAMNKLVDDGLVRNLGIANADTEKVKEFMKFSRHKLTSNEINYSLVDRVYDENGTIKFCEKHGIKILCFKPLARGMMNYVWGIDPLFGELTTKYHMTANQISFAWLLSKPNMFVWMKSANRSHINENLDVFNFTLEKEDLKRLDNWKYQPKDTKMK